MTTWGRRIGAFRTNAPPAWRAAMTQTDRLYYVGATTPESAPALVGMPTHFGSGVTGNFGGGWDVISGYSSGTWLMSDGPHGSQVYGTGGHTRLQNQLLRFRTSDDAPTYDWWQQPTWRTAAGNDAELYYSPGEFSALPVTQIIPVRSDGTVGNASTPTTTEFTPSALTPGSGGVDHLKLRTLQFGAGTATVSLRGLERTILANGSGSLPLITMSSALPEAPASGDTFTIYPEDTARWKDGGMQFPVGFNGWIFPAKLVTGQMGDDVPHGYRYSTTEYIPPSVTGGDGLYFAVLGPQGPFSQSWRPGGVGDTDAEWLDSSAQVSSTVRRWPYYFKNVRTGAWTEHKWQPDNWSIGGFGGPKIGVFRDIKRIYVCGSTVSSYGWYYIDMANGYASHTVSSLVTGKPDIGRYVCGAFSDGDPSGQHFAVFCSGGGSGANRIVVYDFDTGNTHIIDLTSQGFVLDTNDEKVGMSYDRANRRVLIVMQDGGNLQPVYYSITIPATLADTGSYTCVKRTLTLNDAGMTATHFSWVGSMGFLYGSAKLHPTLGVILVRFPQQRMLGFIPSV